MVDVLVMASVMRKAATLVAPNRYGLDSFIVDSSLNLCLGFLAGKAGFIDS